MTALAVALSFIAAAPLNAFAHEIFRWASPWLERLERDKRHPDDEPISLGRAEILIVGMGRVGAGAYDYLREQDENIVGIDSDPAKIESNVREGRRVAYADAEDPSFWHLLNIDRLRAIMLAVPDLAGEGIGGARVAAPRLSRALERDAPVPRGARADHRGRLRRDLQLLHRGRRRFRAPHLRDAAAVGRCCARPGEGREDPAIPVSARVVRRVAGIYKVSPRARPYAAPRCALMMAPSSRGVSLRDADQPSSRRGLTVAISIYDQFVPVFSQMLSALDKVLSKAEADAAARKIDLDVFVNGRLAPDMLPLVRQIQIMTDQAKGCASRLAGQESPKWADDEKTFADLHARVAKTIAHLKTLQAGAVRRRRDARDRAQVPERDVQLHAARTTC